jgi:predicted ATPase
MGIKQGITLIAGGGFHGKSTLLQALEAGVYNKVGWSWCVARLLHTVGSVVRCITRCCRLWKQEHSIRWAIFGDLVFGTAAAQCVIRVVLFERKLVDMEGA